MISNFFFLMNKLRGVGYYCMGRSVTRVPVRLRDTRYREAASRTRRASSSACVLQANRIGSLTRRVPSYFFYYASVKRTRAFNPL